MTQYLIITGATKGIGKALAAHFLKKQNTKVIGIARSEATIAHERYTHHRMDLSDLERLDKEADGIFPALQRGDEAVLVNNAGLLGDIGHLGSTERASFRKVMDVNVTAVAYLMDAFIDRYGGHGGKRVILNISSGAGKSPADGWAAYCASKAAADMLSRVAAEECDMEGNGIRVFAVAPGVVDTEMQTQIRSANEKDFSNLQRFLDLKADGQLSSSEEVAKKLAEVIETPEKFEEVDLDVRRF
ncbi:MAG: SDR family NAD(P)-dependent oxidoreductase [Cryomorphaceae bacterium]|nr:SDR family NAD(P)-dependent oxidoreductase [Flavobacteriales bacterium]